MLRTAPGPSDVRQNIEVPAIVSQKAMKPICMIPLLVALVAAACGTTLGPALEHGAPDPTVAPIVPPSSASPTDPAPVNPTTTLETRPMSDGEATTAPARNAPVPASPLSGDRCNAPSSGDPKVPPSACPPQ